MRPQITLIMERAKSIRRHVLRMAEVVGQGYVGQGLGIADLLAALYVGELRYRPDDLTWQDRDRFVLSIGHYSIALYAALAEAGVIPPDELDTYGLDGSRLEMSGSEFTPGFEMTGGSLGHGLSQAVGMALGLRLSTSQKTEKNEKNEENEKTLTPQSPASPRSPHSVVFCLLSDGELQEGSTWEAAMAGAHFKLDNLFAFIDCNNQQADGPPSVVMNVEPVEEKWQAFGWDTQRIDGNCIPAILQALDESKQTAGKPHAIVLDTLMGKGVPLFEEREKNHFIRVEPHEWAIARRQLEESESRRTRE